MPEQHSENDWHGAPPIPHAGAPLEFDDELAPLDELDIEPPAPELADDVPDDADTLDEPDPLVAVLAPPIPLDD